MIELASRRLHLLGELTFSILAAVLMLGIGYLQNALFDQMIFRIFTAWLFNALAIVLLIRAYDVATIWKRKLPALRADSNGVSTSGIFGQMKFIGWHDVTRITIEEKSVRRNRNPFPMKWNAVVVMTADQSPVCLSESEIAEDLSIVIQQFDRIPAASAKIDDQARNGRSRTFIERATSPYHLLEVGVALMTLYFATQLFFYWKLTH